MLAAPGLDGGRVQVVASPERGQSVDLVRVEVRYRVRTDVPLVGPLVGDPTLTDVPLVGPLVGDPTLTAVVAMRAEDPAG